jgi:hypothetical protein
MNVNEVSERRTEGISRAAAPLELNRGREQNGLYGRWLSGTGETRGTAALCHKPIMLSGIQQSCKRYSGTSVGRPVDWQAAVGGSTKLQDHALRIHFPWNDLSQSSIH